MEANAFVGKQIELLARSTVDGKIWALNRCARPSLS